MVTLPPGPGSDMHPLGPRSENLLGREGVEPGACSTCSPPHTHSAEGGPDLGRVLGHLCCEAFGKTPAGPWFTH